MSLFDLKNIALVILGYPLSYTELIGTLFGLISVYYASKASILTWPSGIVNEVFLFILFFQVQLYADMFLQVYFFLMTIYGWYNWSSVSTSREISEMSFWIKMLTAISIVIGTTIAGFFFSNIHIYLHEYFQAKASYPFSDSFVMVSSIVATILLARKKLETWYLWISVDIVCVVIYFQRGIYFLSLEYIVFLCLASYGLLNWRKQLSNG